MAWTYQQERQNRPVVIPLSPDLTLEEYLTYQTPDGRSVYDLEDEAADRAAQAEEQTE